ncbi:MAG TPA: hypothetical protein VEA63_15915, partial [Opitutus sp.]|nr:hypothetical protein [Opitutus sp.]
MKTASRFAGAALVCVLTIGGLAVTEMRLHAADSAEATEALRVTFVPTAQRLEIAAVGLTAGDYAITIETEELTQVETGDDVNEPGMIYLPPPEGKTEEEMKRGAENVFFFNDLATADGWELVVRFDQEARGTWKLNGRFSSLGGAMEPEVTIPVDALEHGENLLHLRSADLSVPRMFFRKRF